jgi:hypothetical protein
MFIVTRAERQGCAPAGRDALILQEDQWPTTYTQIYIQLVFAPYARMNLIPTKHQEEIYKDITGVVTNQLRKL